jgi:signal transduction histidine kinase
MLKKIDDSKDDFMSMASHQLRTPLTSVKGYLSMLIDGDFGKLTSEQRRVLSEAYISSDRMTFIISDFLDVSRLQTGRFELQKAPVHLDEILNSEVNQLKMTASARKVNLVYESPDNLPIVNCDQNKIRQVVMNMIDNAIFYSHSDSKIEINLYQQGQKIIFTVRDYGIGVPKSEQHKLFEKFFRATNARQARPDGTGVGLYMARKIIIAHGGSVIFESQENVGSTFGFRLPIE